MGSVQVCSYRYDSTLASLTHPPRQWVRSFASNLSSSYTSAVTTLPPKYRPFSAFMAFSASAGKKSRWRTTERYTISQDKQISAEVNSHTIYRVPCLTQFHACQYNHCITHIKATLRISSYTHALDGRPVEKCSLWYLNPFLYSSPITIRLEQRPTFLALYTLA